MDFRGIFHWRSRRDQELEEEIASHLRMAERDRMERGEAPADAHYSVQREFGNVNLVKDVTRETWRAFSFEQAFREVRRAMAGMLRSPGFTLSSTLTLAAGLAAATIMFIVVNCVLLRPLPFREPDRIVAVSDTLPFFGPRPMVVTLQEYLGWRTTGIFDHCAAVDIANMTLTGAGAPERVGGVRVTADFFKIFGVAPALGRGFVEGEDALNAAPTVILSHELWARKFNSDPAILGKAIHLDDEQRTVIGVMPRGFEFPRRIDVGTLMTWAPEETEYWLPFPIRDLDVSRGNFNYLVVGKLRPGIAAGQAQSRLLAVSRGAIAGIVLAVPSARLLRTLLYGVRPGDVRIYTVTIVVLLAAGFTACWLPAYRAARTDPMVALREE